MNKKRLTEKDLNEFQAMFERAIKSPGEWVDFDWDAIPRLIAEVRKYQLEEKKRAEESAFSKIIMGFSELVTGK